MFGIGLMLEVVLIILFSILLFGVKAHAINNPADQSASYAQFNFEFYKMCFDAGGARWFDFSFPMGEKKMPISILTTGFRGMERARTSAFRCQRDFPKT